MTYSIEIKKEMLIFEINRPAIHNAINGDVMEGFKQLINNVKTNEEIKLVVITGAGEKTFCSGGDLAVFHKLKTEEESYGMLSETAKILYELATLPVPTIALVNGTAVGGGCEIATLCDFRLVKKDAKCGFIQGTLGITSGWGGGTYLFEKGMRHDYILQMLTEAVPYSTDRLMSIGWATEIYEGDKLSAVNQFAEKMIIPHVNVLKAYKLQAIRKWEQTRLYDRIMDEVATCSVLWAQDAHHEAVDSFLSKKK
ncbi:enoyl-CoA hydratase/carnithine racemase [Psychrobacillus insolitus]|uniref:Ethylmalonyl-CoA decarboxylase n=1 Tax=Psychrobacillus insolitus TaxID=1461 RepID=A0A2W7MW76_9BACI|nr:enoyl-CoA hydratase/isomerase family protein [Psychrobacillus insolitus]PZX08061.1 enoyl-CoA hydratase/carnithine racemase [Psychrobacillus insolitus]